METINYLQLKLPTYIIIIIIEVPIQSEAVLKIGKTLIILLALSLGHLYNSFGMKKTK